MSAALHQVRADFYSFNGLNEVAPADKWGWAASAGIVLNLPWNPGDKFWIEGGVGQGASAYTGFSQTTAFNRFNGTSVAAGWVLDGVFARNPAFPTSGIQLSTSWDITAAIEHYWTPALRTSLFGSYTAWDPDSAGNAIMCKSPDGVVRTTAGLGPTGTTALVGCDFGFAVWAVGTRTIWNPVKNLRSCIPRSTRIWIPAEFP